MKKNYSRRYANEFNVFRIIYQVLWCVFIALPLFWLFYKFEIRGRENIPKDRKFICASNHISEFDPFLVSIAVLKPIAYMAKKELFEESTFNRINMDWLGAFGVNREKLEVSTIKTVKELFKTPWFLGIFPEGGIKRNRKIEQINKGFAVIAKAAKWDILPIGIIGCEEYNWIPFKSKIVVQIGKPVSYLRSQDEIISEWSKQVASMNHYEYVETASENSEVQDQQEFAEV